MWRTVYTISDNDNADFCRQTEDLFNTYLENTDQHRHYERIDLARLIPDNELTRPITLEEIMMKIRQQKGRKAPGRSKIDKEVLMKLPRIMIDCLTIVFNASLSAGFFPNKFKIAVIKLLFKSGEVPTNSLHYRPISLLETTGKIYEKLINNRLRNYLEINERFNAKQHVYRKDRGTATAIAPAYETIATGQQNRHQCNVVLRDVSEAFDKVWHNGLKYKLCISDVPRCFTVLLCSYLDNRQAIIHVGDHLAEPFPILCGVPQGSVITPTLYSFFIPPT